MGQGQLSHSHLPQIPPPPVCGRQSLLITQPNAYPRTPLPAHLPGFSGHPPPRNHSSRSPHAHRDQPHVCPQLRSTPIGGCGIGGVRSQVRRTSIQRSHRSPRQPSGGSLGGRQWGCPPGPYGHHTYASRTTPESGPSCTCIGNAHRPCRPVRFPQFSVTPPLRGGWRVLQPRPDPPPPTA